MANALEDERASVATRRIAVRHIRLEKLRN
jgi:hypothetical protein